MSEIVNNLNTQTTGTPIYNYPMPAVAVNPAENTNNNSQYTNQIYQYPQTSLYTNQPMPQYSGVNINIYNPAGMAGNTAPVPMVNNMQPSQPTGSVQNSETSNAPTNLNAASSLTNNIVNDKPSANTPINNLPEQNNNGKTKYIVELTDDYIKTLENYLRNPSEDLRKAAIKELIKRFEEDKTRYNNPALTALLNIALQDPSASNRLLAMSPIASGEAAGDKNTLKLLNNLASSDKLYGQEAKMAHDSLLNASQNRIEVPDYSSDKNK